MRRPADRLSAIVLAVGSLGMPVVAAGPAVEPLPIEAITLPIGHARVLDSGPVRRIAVGNGKIIQATALDQSQVLLLPEAEGQSSLHLWPRRNPMRRYLITVVPRDLSGQLDEIRQMIGPASNLRVRQAGEALLIEGEGLSVAQQGQLQAIVKRHPQVIDMASQPGSERMIAMDVQVIEIKKSVLKKIGVRWSGSSAGPSFGVIGDLHRSQALTQGTLASELGLVARPAVSPFATTFGIASSISSMLDYLVQNGDAVILAEPRLSCRSGGSARFVAGGELPIPTTGGLGAVTVSFKEYGVKFDFSPTAGSDGMIAAQIATEVSAIDFEVQVKEVPGLIKRRAETEVNLQENQTLVIAGLLSEDTSRHVDKVHGLGDIPILGQLFRSRDYRASQTDLAVFVTPRFVNDPATDAAVRPSGGQAIPDAQAARDASLRLQILE
ncbi:MAG: pilus assembly protein N-terminal domain-containing protein [Burkholderiaceae bacterium]